MVEWTTSGRIAMGESWAFNVLETTNEVWLDGSLLIREAMRLSDKDGPPSVKERMHPYTTMASVIMVGPRVLPYAKTALELVNKMQVKSNHKSDNHRELVCSASALKVLKAGQEHTVGVVVKVAAETSAQVVEFIHTVLSTAWKELLGDDPYK